MIDFLSACSMMLELFVVMHFLNGIFEKKRKSYQVNIIAVASYAVHIATFVVFDNQIINMVINCLAIFAIIVPCYNCKLKTAFLCSLFIYAIIMASEFLVMTILSLITTGDINEYSATALSYSITCAISKLILLILLKLFMSLGFRFSKRIETKTPFFLFLFPFCSSIILITFWMIATKYNLDKTFQTIIFISCITIVLSIVLTYFFYGKTTKELDELYAKQREADRVKADTAYYALLDKQNNTLKTFIHDEKNHLSAIKSLANNEEVNKYIDKIYGEIKYHSMLGNTKNKTLDLIINKYIYLCEEKNINLDVSVKTANLSFIDDADLITMLSNLLDNAVEAAKATSEKRIDFSVNKVNSFDVLTVTNSCDIKPISVGKKLKTTKKDTSVHGLGIGSVIKTANKYRANFHWEYDENKKLFSAVITFRGDKINGRIMNLE